MELDYYSKRSVKLDPRKWQKFVEKYGRDLLLDQDVVFGDIDINVGFETEEDKNGFLDYIKTSGLEVKDNNLLVPKGTEITLCSREDEIGCQFEILGHEDGDPYYIVHPVKVFYMENN